MAAHHLTPADGNLTPADGNVMTIDEAVAFLGYTPYPVSRSTLENLLKGAPRTRAGRRYVYQTADVLERHRDYARSRPTPKG